MFIIVIVFNLSPCQATEPNIPLHIQIDNLVSKRQSALKISPAKISTDEEFVRRVYLDLNGSTHTWDKAPYIVVVTSQGYNAITIVIPYLDRAIFRTSSERKTVVPIQETDIP